MSLTLTDATPVTPVDRTFVATQSAPDLTIWKDYTTNRGYSLGAGVASVSVRENGGGVHRVAVKLVLPTLETVSGDTDLGFEPAPIKAFECLGSLDLVFPARASLQNRKDLKAMMIDLISDAVVTAAVENFVHPTG
jgi:hypothetical protein